MRRSKVLEKYIVRKIDAYFFHSQFFGRFTSVKSNDWLDGIEVSISYVDIVMLNPERV